MYQCKQKKCVGSARSHRAPTLYAAQRAEGPRRAGAVEASMELAKRDGLLRERFRCRDRLSPSFGVRQEQLAARAARPHSDLARNDGLDVAQRLG